MTVALASIPSSVAYANIAGVSPLVGVWSSVVVGLVAPLLGSRPGVISGAASVVAVPLAGLVATRGAGVITVVIALAALIELLFAVAKLGRFISLVTDPVMAGFLNGLGLLLFKSQLKVFNHAPDLPAALTVAAGTAALVKLIPRLSKAVPASLAAIVLASTAAKALKLNLETLASTCGPATFAGGLSVLPRLVSPPTLSLELLRAVCVPAASIAFISVLEMLLASKVADEAAARNRSGSASDGASAPADALARLEDGATPPDRSIAAMAGGNALSALLGGFGGCGLIPQTVLNAQSGGRGRLSAAAYAVAMALFVVFAAPLVGAVPLACLAGVMCTVGAATVQWLPTASAARDLATLRRLPEAAALLIATAVCFKVDMAVGIVLAVVVERGLRAVLRPSAGGVA